MADDAGTVGAAGPFFSPDGKWIAYTSDSNGTSEVYVRALPDHGGLWKITEGGGDWAMFSPKPGELLFSAHGSLMSVTYTEKAGAFVWEKPKTVIEKLTGRVAAFAPDTKRVLLLETDRPQGQDSTSHQIVLFQNFLDYLRQRIPI